MPTAKKPSAKKTTAPKSAAKAKSSKSGTKKSTAHPKVSTVETTVPRGPEYKFAETALGLIDQAASLLRDGVRTGASTTAKSRIAAQKRANALIGQATSHLAKAIEKGGANVQKIVGR